MKKLLIVSVTVFSFLVAAYQLTPGNRRDREREERREFSEARARQPDKDMRRRDPAVVKVKAPSRGLVTRLPSELADRLSDQDRRRTFAAAKNTRFEDGCVTAAPGYERCQLTDAFGLSTNLVSHWKLDELSGTRFDSHSTNHLYPDGAVEPTGVAGKINGSVGFISDSSFLLDAPDLEPGSGVPALGMSGVSGFTICGWFYREFASTGIRLLGRGGPGASESSSYFADPLEYEVVFNGTNLQCRVQNSSGTTTTATAVVAISDDTWYFFAATYSGTEITMRVNATTGTPVAHAGGIRDDAGQFHMSGVAYGDPPSIRLDSVSLWKNRVLSGADLDLLYAAGAGFNYPFINGSFQFSWQANYLQALPYPLFLGSTKYFYSVSRDFQAEPRKYLATLATIYTHPGSGATLEHRWQATDFYDKVIFCQHDIPPQFYTTGSSTTILPGLPDNSTFDGVTAFQNHLLLWKDQTLKWGELNSHSIFIPVAETIASLTLTTANSFTQPAAGADTPLPPAAGSVYVTTSTAGLTVGQYVRIDESTFVNYYTVKAVSPSAGLSATSVASSQTALQNAETRIFITAHTDWDTGQLVVAGVSTNVMEVRSVSTSTTDVYLVGADAELSGDLVAGLKLTVSTANLRAGDYVSLGPTNAPGVDIYLITAAVTDATGVTSLDLTQQNQGSSQRVPGGGLEILKGTVLSLQPWAILKEFNVGAVSITASMAITEKYGIQLTTEALSGRRAAAGTVPTTQTLLTVDANEAGEVLVVGADDNGPIWVVVNLGDYAVAMKNRSIQVLQYVGRLSGVFHLRTEVRNEGLIARNAYKQLNSDRIVFLGNRELYLYRGGQSPQPICMQYTRQLYKELDRTRLNEIILLHKEPRNEVWVVYPVVGGQKVLVWNYVEDTATIDEYPVALGILTALAQCRWETDPTWDDFSDQSWDQISDTTTWDSLVGTGDELVSIVCTNDGSLLVHGRVFNREGEAYEASAETMDHDFDDASLVKYVEAIQLSLQIFTPEGTPRRLYVQVGTKMDADDTITWSARQTVYVQGDGQTTTKVNVSQGGRFVRLRFISDETDVAWRVSGYTIFARRGSTY